MPALVWISAILLILAGCGAFFWRMGARNSARWTKAAADDERSYDSRRQFEGRAEDSEFLAIGGRLVTVVLGALAILLALLSCFTVVPANQGRHRHQLRIMVRHRA